ncbi:hypothetical protein GQ55_2G429000 [Panicum hallii var. hallii]|uniref:Uncharacterized protein n=1 Tax=Panicum hallii var. hallii TaxID=1504633 RepID=A0A2T7EYF3_9POAL|nr:hypothetical protein GQ55_2G429000 [Panicum hallii var. hallii]
MDSPPLGAILQAANGTSARPRPRFVPLSRRPLRYRPTAETSSSRRRQTRCPFRSVAFGWALSLRSEDRRTHHS